MLILTTAAIIAAVVAWRRGEPIMLGQRLRCIWEFIGTPRFLKPAGVCFTIFVFVWIVFVFSWAASQGL